MPRSSYSRPNVHIGAEGPRPQNFWWSLDLPHFSYSKMLEITSFAIFIEFVQFILVMFIISKFELYKVCTKFKCSFWKVSILSILCICSHTQIHNTDMIKMIHIEFVSHTFIVAPKWPHFCMSERNATISPPFRSRISQSSRPAFYITGPTGCLHAPLSAGQFKVQPAWSSQASRVSLSACIDAEQRRMSDEWELRLRDVVCSERVGLAEIIAHRRAPPCRQALAGRPSVRRHFSLRLITL